MKKYLLTTLLATLFLLPACKKENNNTEPTTPEPKNPIVEDLNLCKSFFGADTSAVYGQLVNDGWSMTRNDSVRVYLKLDGNNIRHELELQNNNGVVSIVSVELIEMNGEATLVNANAFQECMSSIGQNCTIAGINFSFMCMLYYAGTKPAMEEDYSAALNLIPEIFSGEFVNPVWSESETHHSLTLSKRYDKDAGKDTIHIGIG